MSFKSIFSPRYPLTQSPNIEFCENQAYKKVKSLDEINEGDMIGLCSRSNEIQTIEIDKMKIFYDKNNELKLAYQFEVREQIIFKQNRPQITFINFWNEGEDTKERFEQGQENNQFGIDMMISKKDLNFRKPSQFNGVYIIDKKLKNYLIYEASRVKNGEKKEISSKREIPQLYDIKN